MFEVTIRTDNQAELQKLLEFIEAFNLKVFKVPDLKEGKIALDISKKETFPSGKKGKKKVVKWGGMDVDISNIEPGFGCAKGMFEMSPDFDEPLEDFKEYMY